MMNGSISWKRLAVYLLGLLVYAYGACMMVVANVGISPLTSVAYILTVVTPMTLGSTLFIFSILLIFVQVLILRRKFEKKQLLQIPASVVFSAFINLIMPLTTLFVADQLFPRCVLFAVGIIAMAFGITAMSAADIAMPPGDGVPKAIAGKTGWPFGKAKVFSDSICVAITAAISLLVLRRVEGIQIGTLVAALCLGNVARFLMRYMGKGLSLLMAYEPQCQQESGSQEGAA